MNEATKQTGRKQAARRAVGYVRVSRVGGRSGESFISPDVQRSTIEELARKHGYRIVAWFEELDESGKQGSAAERPAFEEAVAMIEERQAEALLVWKQNRFSRGIIDTAQTIARIEAVGGHFHAGDLDVSGPFAKVMRTMVASFAEVEVDVLTEGWRTAQASAIERGVAIKSHAPFGYRFDSSHRLAVVPADAAIVVELFQRRRDGAGLGELARWFEDATGKARSRGTIKQMLANESYAGVLRFADHVNADAHAPIVDAELFAGVQELQAAITSAHVLGRRVDHGKAKSLLAGIARCKHCGRSLACIPNGKKKTPTYRCPSERTRCPERGSIVAAELDAYVEAEVLAWAGPVLDVDVELELELAGVGDRVVVEHRLAEAKSLLADYVTSTAVQALDVTLFEAGLAARQDAVDALELELEGLGQASGIELATTTLRQEWPTLSTAERRRLLAVVLDRVDVRRTPRRGAPASERARVLFQKSPSPALQDATELLEEAIA